MKQSTRALSMYIQFHVSAELLTLLFKSSQQRDGQSCSVLLSSRALIWALAVSESCTRKAAQAGCNVLLEPWPFLLEYCEKPTAKYSFICIQPGCSAFRPPFLCAADRMSRGSDTAVTLHMSWSTSIWTWFLSSNESSHRSPVWEKKCPKEASWS